MPKYSKKKEIERNDPSKAQTPEECGKSVYMTRFYVMVGNPCQQKKVAA